MRYKEDDLKSEWYCANRKDWMNDDQWECWRVLGDVYGFNHIFDEPKREAENGISVKPYCLCMATYDDKYLTQLVFLCHDRKIRMSIQPGDREHVKIVLHRRTVRAGDIAKRHPTIEKALEEWRSNNG